MKRMAEIVIFLKVIMVKLIIG